MGRYATLVQMIVDATTAGKALLTAANAAAQRTLLGLGTSAVRDEGYFAVADTHGHTVINLDGTSIVDMDGNGNTRITTATSKGIVLAPLNDVVSIIRGTSQPQSWQVANTWSASDDFELLRIAAATTEYQIGSIPGAAAGSNRPVKLGHFNGAGTFTAAMTVATNGTVSFANSISASNLSGTNTGDQDLSSYATTAAVAAAVAAGYQPLDSDLTAIAALTTTAFGRGALTAADAAAFRTYIGVSGSSFDGQFSSLTGLPTTLSGYGITDAQPLDSDLTAIAALTTTSFGRSLLTQADAAATRSTIGAGTSSFDGAYSSLSGIPSTFPPEAHNQAWSTITSTPTTLSGYGISDAISAADAASTYLALSGGTLTGPVVFPASTTSIACLRLSPGSGTPSSPSDGDMWYMSSALNLRVSATTRIFAWRNVNNSFNSQQFFNASTASLSSIRCPPGSGTPSTLANGDIWCTSVGSFWYINGAAQRTLTHAPTWNTYSPAGGATATLLLSETGSNLHKVTRPTSGNITIAFSGDSANQTFLLVLETSGSGTPGTVTWPSGITWLTNAGVAPTISTANNKTDSVMFLRTGAGAYLAWHTGQN